MAETPSFFDTNTPTGDVMARLNDNFKAIDDENRTKIIKDGDTPRVLIGYQKDGFGTELFDTNNNLSGGVYTAPVDGFYMFAGRVSCVGVPGLASGIGALLTHSSGLTYDGVYTYDNNVSFDIVTSTCQILTQMTAGQTMTLQGIYQSNNGSNGYFSAGRSATNFFGFLVSRT